MRAYNAVEIVTNGRKKSEVAICQHDAVGDVETRRIGWLETDAPCCPVPCEIAAVRTFGNNHESLPRIREFQAFSDSSLGSPMNNWLFQESLEGLSIV